MTASQAIAFLLKGKDDEVFDRTLSLALLNMEAEGMKSWHGQDPFTRSQFEYATRYTRYTAKIRKSCV